MSDETYVAVVVAANGKVWESTAALCTGTEAEMHARLWSQDKFVKEVIGPFFPNISRAKAFSVWDLASDNGYQCVSMLVDNVADKQP